MIESHVAKPGGLHCNYVTPQQANHFPHLLIEWDETALRLTRDELAEKLRSGKPPIVTGRVYGTGSNGLLISAINLQAGEEDVVGRRLNECFGLKSA